MKHRASGPWKFVRASIGLSVREHVNKGFPHEVLACSLSPVCAFPWLPGITASMTQLDYHGVIGTASQMTCHDVTGSTAQLIRRTVTCGPLDLQC